MIIIIPFKKVDDLDIINIKPDIYLNELYTYENDLDSAIKHCESRLKRNNKVRDVYKCRAGNNINKVYCIINNITIVGYYIIKKKGIICKQKK